MNCVNLQVLVVHNTTRVEFLLENLPHILESLAVVSEQHRPIEADAVPMRYLRRDWSQCETEGHLQIMEEYGVWPEHVVFYGCETRVIHSWTYLSL